jgi:hypothetical protein
LDNFTVESPIPYNISNVLSALEDKDKEMIRGSTAKGKQGPLYNASISS